jgi:hypothetical protein
MKHYFGHLLLLSVAVITVCVVGLVYAYMWHTTNASIQESILARQAVMSATSNKTHDQAFMQMYQATADSWAKLPKLFVRPNDVVAFIVAVESLGSNIGAATTISAIDADNLENAKPGTMGIIHAHVDVQGSWSAVIRTLELAEIMPYKVDVSGVSLTADPSGSSKNSLGWRLGFDIKAAMMVELPAGPTATAATSTVH